jgi:hypothetical protein
MREVMRYAGPRMLWRHPLLAVAHLIDGRRPARPQPNSQAAAQDQIRRVHRHAEAAARIGRPSA